MAVVKNANTHTDYWKSLSEIHMILAKGGADHINVRHEAGIPVGMSFTISIDNFPINFMLPVHIDGLAELLKSDRHGRMLRGAKDFDDKVLRVGWRIVKDWVDAQIAFIEARKAEDRLRALATAFLPYAVNTNGVTLADKILNNPGNIKMLQG
jgi:hypothetical protein